jgi:flagellar FliL protein
MSDTAASNVSSSASFRETALAMLVLTAMGAGVGVLSDSLPASTDEAPTPPHASATASIRIVELPAIITNLSIPSDTWVRFEGAIVVDSGLESDVQALIGEMNNDIIAYLRTLTLAQIEGPSGFQILRQALNERVAIRSKGKVNELVIRTMVVQ